MRGYYRHRRMDMVNILAILVVVLCIMVVSLVYTVSQFQSETAQSQVPLAPKTYTGPAQPPGLEGFVTAEVDVIPGVIYLSHGCWELAMVTTESQTYSIETGILGIVEYRPTTHDVFRDLMESYSMSITRAQIEDINGNSYYASLVVESPGKVLTLDTRPSDSIAMAIRFGAPIYVREGLFEDKGEWIC